MAVLERQAAAGLDVRLAALRRQAPADRPLDRRPYDERLRTELDVIVRMGYPGYFLIVADFIRWAREHDVPVGPGRASS